MPTLIAQRVDVQAHLDHRAREGRPPPKEVVSRGTVVLAGGAIAVAAFAGVFAWGRMYAPDSHVAPEAPAAVVAPEPVPPAVAPAPPPEPEAAPQPIAEIPPPTEAESAEAVPEEPLEEEAIAEDESKPTVRARAGRWRLSRRVEERAVAPAPEPTPAPAPKAAAVALEPDLSNPYTKSAASQPKAAPSPAQQPAPAPKPAAASGGGDCSQPYRIDSDGIRRIKPECL
jgi:hypothetical protein